MDYYVTFWNRNTGEILQQRRQSKTIGICKRAFLRMLGKEDLSCYIIFICDNSKNQDFIWDNIYNPSVLTTLEYDYNEFLIEATNCGVAIFKALYRKEGLKK